MARPLRIEYPGAYYHVMNRGNRREDIFLTYQDRKVFLDGLADSCEIYHIKLFTYVLMAKHFDLLVQTPQANLSEFMRHFLVTYTVLGLEKAHQFQAAVSGYRTALTRWPQSLTARMGVGNSYYELGDFMNSENAFREIIRLHPRAVAADNNLAQILMERGRYPEALEMARKAVSLGGPLQALYHQTLQEIESKMSQ